MSLTISNPAPPLGSTAVLGSSSVLGSSLSRPGGHGLVGMRERFAAVPGGSATAAVESGFFVVRVAGETA